MFLREVVSAQVITDPNSVIPQIIASSPQAASLGSYGAKSINMFTGKPDINIDLYTLRQGDFSLPISLSYNTDLVKPNEHPGIMGLGWSLFSGGAITRSVRGGVDEYLPSSSSYQRQSYYDDFGVLNRDDWNSQDFLHTLSTGLRSAFATGLYEYRAFPSPDQFHFNVNGMAGSFYKDHEGKWVVSSSDNIDIRITDSVVRDYTITEQIYGDEHIQRNSAVKRIIYGFTLTDDKGYKYIFGMAPNSIEFSANADGAIAENYGNFIAKTWFLTKIIAPNSNQHIDFSYTFDNRPVLQLYSTFAGGKTYVCRDEKKYNQQYYSIVRNYNVYIASIKTEDVEINFYKSHSNDLDFKVKELSETSSNNPWALYAAEYGPFGSGFLAGYAQAKHWYKLDSIVVKSPMSGARIYKAVPDYLEVPTSRLYLTGLNEYGTNDDDMKSYEFGYSSVALPEYATMEVDHWGFYNGKNFFSSEAPSQGLWYSLGQFNNVFPLYKEPSIDLAISSAGYLNKITYPTKGTDYIIYEQNNYSSYVQANPTSLSFNVLNNQTNHPAGGLRVKKIISNPGNSLGLVTKEYFYVRDLISGDFRSSGVLSGIPKYFEMANDGVGFEYYKFKVNPILTDNNTRGNHITYSKVYEKISEDGITEYTFTNHDNGFTDHSAFTYFQNYLTQDSEGNLLYMNKLAFTSLEHERGKPLFIRTYDKAHDLLKKEFYTYSIPLSSPLSGIRSLDYQSEFYGEPSSNGIFLDLCTLFEAIRYAAVSTYSYHSHPESKTTVTYDRTTGDSIVYKEEFTYNTGLSHQLKSISSSKSSDLSKRKSWRYPTDFPTHPVYQQMVDRHMLNLVVEDSLIINNIPIQLLRTNYGQFQSGYQTQLFLLPASHERKMGAGSAVLDYTINSYTPKGKISEIQHRDGTLESYIWGYNFEYPIARIRSSGTTYDAALTMMGSNWSSSNSPHLAEVDMIDKLNDLRGNLVDSNAQVWTYTYKPLVGMTSETDPTGKIVRYDYDGLGRLIHRWDKDNNLIDKLRYNYSNAPVANLYSNAASSAIFVVNTCQVGQVGDQVTYTVAAGTYYSNISQADADLQAQQDIDANGQDYANANGGCKVNVTANNIGMTADIIGVLYFTNAQGDVFTLGRNSTTTMQLTPGMYTIKFATPGIKALFDINGETLKLVDNLPGGETVLGTFSIRANFYISAGTTYYGNGAKSQNFVRNNCTAGLSGSTVTYTVPANKYYSLISQADADQKALNEVNGNGQNYANVNGSCNSVVSIALQKTSTVSNFDPVTVQFIPSGLSSGATHNFPTSNTGSSNVSVSEGSYQLKFTIPSVINAFDVLIYHNGQQIGKIPAGKTTETIARTITTGSGQILKVVINPYL